PPEPRGSLDRGARALRARQSRRGGPGRAPVGGRRRVSGRPGAPRRHPGAAGPERGRAPAGRRRAGPGPAPGRPDAAPRDPADRWSRRVPDLRGRLRAGGGTGPLHARRRGRLARRRGLGRATGPARRRAGRAGRARRAGRLARPPLPGPGGAEAPIFPDNGHGKGTVRMRKTPVLAGLDVGTTKVCALIGELTSTGVDVVGIGQYPSRGLRKGMVVNIDSTVEAIKRAIADAEQMAGVEVESVYTSIGGGHISGINSQGVVAIQGRTREGAGPDVERASEVARDVHLPPDREILHVLTQAFSVDDQDGIREPIGMLGSRLGVEVHLITGAVAAAQNVVRAVNRAGLTVKDLVLQPLA